MAGFENSSIPDLNPHLNVTSADFFHLDIFTACVMCFNVLLGPPTHAYILWLIVSTRRTTSEFLNLNLSVCEIGISVSYFIYFFKAKFPGVLSFLSFAAGLDMVGRPLFQCLMCVERYLAVVHPVTFLKYKPLRYRVVCCAVAWMIVLAACLFSMFAAATHVYVYMCGLLLQFLLFLSINLFCCLSVLWALKKPGPGERGMDREEKNQMKRRAFYLILIITVTMVIMFTPVIILVFVYVLLSADLSIFKSFSFLCFALAGFVHPVLYFYRLGKLAALCCVFHRSNNNNINNNNSIVL